MQERFKFVLDAEKGEKSIAQLCREFGVSRTSAYKWLRRYDDEPYPEALDDQSRRPIHSPWRTEERVEDVVVAARKRYPNQLWCIDFKGHFDTLDGTTIHPLTITDAFSRLVLRCEVVLEPRSAEVRDVLESAFREYGLPEAIRSDNGPPFASTGPGGLTELSAWWIQLGIRHERIEPGKPQQNGRHERMHRTLKYETATPPAKTPRGQQSRFDRWRKEFNCERPHEALAMATPMSVYSPSARRFDEKLTRDQYAFDIERALVDDKGHIRWHKRRVFIATALRDQLVELRPTRHRRRWVVSFGPVLLGHYDERAKHPRLKPLAKLRKVQTMS